MECFVTIEVTVTFYPLFFKKKTYECTPYLRTLVMNQQLHQFWQFDNANTIPANANFHWKYIISNHECLASHRCHWGVKPLTLKSKFFLIYFIGPSIVYELFGYVNPLIKKNLHTLKRFCLPWIHSIHFIKNFRSKFDFKMKAKSSFRSTLILDIFELIMWHNIHSTEQLKL